MNKYNKLLREIKFGIKSKFVFVVFIVLLIFLFFFQIYYYQKREFVLTDNFTAYDFQEDPILKAKLSRSKDLKIKVDVSGEVKKPGVYELSGGSNLYQAIQEAGGFSDKADKAFVDQNLNLASILDDQQKIYIPAKATQIDQTQIKEVSPGSKININTATQTELELLDGIGPSIAKKIIKARPFKKIEDLKKVSGIGDAKFNAVKDEISV